ncbi:acyl-CoA dehydrogenase family protein [Streptomyces sp. NPDC094049]|uniref:acyl-CoA dehydrogenase family protein n=1 Tax=Streptomyces sp. NPDC094049 TaxID=3154987 RepID=UPI0033290C34
MPVATASAPAPTPAPAEPTSGPAPAHVPTATPTPALTPVPAPGAPAVGHLRAVAARRAEESERSGVLHPEVVAALTGAGLARHFVPRRWGGTAGTFTALLDTVAGVGAACASTAWCGVLLAAHGRLAAHLPAEGQRELWGDSPDTRVAAAVVPPAGRLTRVPGGWTLSGEWAFASGVEHAEWLLLASLDRTGPGAPGYRVLAVPRERVGIRETWDAVGLRATGSHSVAVDAADAVFVPEHRTFLREELMTGATEAAEPGGVPAPCHRVPYPLVAALLFAAPALGAARGALDAWTVLTGLRRLPDGSPLTADPVVQQTFARCAAEIDAAHLLLRSAAARADGWAGTGAGGGAQDDRSTGTGPTGAGHSLGPLTPAPATPGPTPCACNPAGSVTGGAAAVALNQRDAAVAVDLLTGAVERLMRTGGARGLIAGGGLERAWRDLHAIGAHAALQPAPAAAAYAATVFPPGA